jgi:hypothetical protein
MPSITETETKPRLITIQNVKCEVSKYVDHLAYSGELRLAVSL